MLTKNDVVAPIDATIIVVSNVFGLIAIIDISVPPIVPITESPVLSVIILNFSFYTKLCIINEKKKKITFTKLWLLLGCKTNKKQPFLVAFLLYLSTQLQFPFPTIQ